MGSFVSLNRASQKCYDLTKNSDVQDISRFRAFHHGNSDKLVRYVRNSIIGHLAPFRGPFGERRLLYCDYVASGRSLDFIEKFIAGEILPFYGNTHTSTGVTSVQTTAFMHEAREIVRNAVNASEQDAVVFTGSGATGAIHKLISILRPSNWTEVVVFVSTIEHHSSLLPWRELDGCEVVYIRNQPNDEKIDLEHLEQELRSRTSEKKLAGSTLMIGCFTAVSNITGTLQDDLAITALLHKFGCLSFWDYAAAAPHVIIDVNPKIPQDLDHLCYKDAIYFSMHKFLGGVQTPGILVAKQSLFRNPKPEFGGGGGSVLFVTTTDHHYLRDIETREESGTPAIVETIRAGIVMQLHQDIGPENILNRDRDLMRKAKHHLICIPSFCLLGPGFADPGNHLSTLSFMIKAPKEAVGEGQLFLHHNFVSTLLNDLFGIQSRGGCACAGPYSQVLMGISLETTRAYGQVMVEHERLEHLYLRGEDKYHSNFEILKPGFTRLNLPWSSTDKEVDYILKALAMVAEDGWKLMPQYIFNKASGEWKHHSNLVFKDRQRLGTVSYGRKCFEFEFDPPVLTKDHIDDSVSDGYFNRVLKEAKELVSDATKAVQKIKVPDHRPLFQGESVEKLRWMLLPIEARDALLKTMNDVGNVSSIINAPFELKSYPFKDQGANKDKAVGSMTSRTSRWVRQDLLLKEVELGQQNLAPFPFHSG